MSAIHDIFSKPLAVMSTRHINYCMVQAPQTKIVVRISRTPCRFEGLQPPLQRRDGKTEYYHLLLSIYTRLPPWRNEIFRLQFEIASRS